MLYLFGRIGGGLRVANPANHRPPPSRATGVRLAPPPSYLWAAKAPSARLRRTRPSLKKKNPRAGTHGGQPSQPLNLPRCAEPKGFLPENPTHTAFGQRRITNPIPSNVRPPFQPCKAALVAAVCPRPKGGKALAENPLRRGQPAANQRGESGCRPYGGKPTSPRAARAANKFSLPQ